MRPEIFASFVEHLDRLAQDPLEKHAQYHPEYLAPEVRPPEKTTLEKALPLLAAAGLTVGAASGVPALMRAGLGPGMWSILRRGALGGGLGMLPSVGYYGARGAQDMAKGLRGDSDDPP
jgi:hypothetical protein